LAARGFNQAAEIATPVAQRLGLPLRTDACTRVRHTVEQMSLTGRARVEQMSLTGRARRRNLVGAFAVQCDLTGLRVAIIDDVLTTGTTARAVATAIMQSGAREAQIWTVARTG